MNSNVRRAHNGGRNTHCQTGDPGPRGHFLSKDARCMYSKTKRDRESKLARGDTARFWGLFVSSCSIFSGPFVSFCCCCSGARGVGNVAFLGDSVSANGAAVPGAPTSGAHSQLCGTFGGACFLIAAAAAPAAAAVDLLTVASALHSICSACNTTMYAWPHMRLLPLLFIKATSIVFVSLQRLQLQQQSLLQLSGTRSCS